MASLTHQYIGCLATLWVASLSFSSIEDIRILTLDESRTDVCTRNGLTWDENFRSGNVFSVARSWLADDMYFSPSGIVERSILLSASSEISDFELANVDVVVLPPIQSEYLTSCELRELRNFVDQGGGLVVVANEAAERYGPLFFASGLPGGSGSSATFVSDEVTEGPFGDIAGIPMALNFHRHFGSLGPLGRPLWVEAGGLVVAAAFEFGQGRVVLINDEEWVASVNVQGCGIVSQDLGTARIFLLNTVAFVTPDVGFVYSGVPYECSIDFDNNCELNFFDASLFLTYYNSSNSLADLNKDGLFNFFDVSAFISLFYNGCE